MLKQFLFRYQGAISAALVLGGVDFKGPYIYTVYPHGSTDNLGYATMVSGSLAAMSVFEARYKDGMDVDEAKNWSKTPSRLVSSTIWVLEATVTFV